MRKKKTTEEIIKTANQIHNFKYDYSKTEYVNIKQKICIICHEEDEFGEEHGEFWQTPDNHINGKQGCPKCAKNVNFTTDKFIKKSKLIHDNKYDYSKVKYNGSDNKVVIICPKHGKFEQLPQNHLYGHGCPICKQSKLEVEIKNILIENNINFEQQKRFDWLGKQSLDFYLPDHNIAIECQGIQHFEPVNHFGGKERFKIQTQRDHTKKYLCEKNNVILLYFTNLELYQNNKTILNSQQIVKKIKEIC